MKPFLVRHCLERLRDVDAILVEQGETALAAHLSLVIERLAERVTPEAGCPFPRTPG